MDASLIQNLSILIIPTLFAITLHEFSHAYVAKLRGDNTAYIAGRVTLNPINHIDIWGTVILPLVLYIFSSGMMLFGYAKPVPINSRNFKNYTKDMFLTILAGPLANLIMAFIWSLILLILIKLQINEPFFIKMARYGQMINFMLFAFNLFPLLPLDGGRILLLFLPYKYATLLSKLEPYSMIIVFALFALGIFNFWLQPIMQFSSLIFNFIMQI